MTYPQNIEQKFTELLNALEKHLVPDHYPRNHLKETLPLSVYSPRFGKRETDEGLYVMKVDENFQLWYTERGESGMILESADMDDVLYHLFEGITQSLATSFEARNRNPKTEDTRRDWFPIQENLMGQLSDKWREKLHQKLSKLI